MSKRDNMARASFEALYGDGAVISDDVEKVYRLRMLVSAATGDMLDYILMLDGDRLTVVPGIQVFDVGWATARSMTDARTMLLPFLFTSDHPEAGRFRRGVAGMNLRMAYSRHSGLRRIPAALRARL